MTKSDMKKKELKHKAEAEKEGLKHA